MSQTTPAGSAAPAAARPHKRTILVVDDVEINNADGADTRCGQIERDGGTEPTRPHNEDFCGVDFPLSLDADIGKEYMAAIPLNFFF